MIRVDGEVLRLEGDFTMTTAGAVREEGRRLVAGGDRVLDLSALGTADSAALALLFDWLRCARAAGRRLTVRGLPPGLASLAALYGVDALLPLES